MVFALALEMGTAVLVTWLTWSAAKGRLARNTIAGVRTSVTTSSDETWRIGHRAALGPTIISAAATVVWCALSITIMPLSTPTSVIVAAGVLVAGALISVPIAHRAVRRASAER